jgi:hypothetical protein
MWCNARRGPVPATPLKLDAMTDTAVSPKLPGSIRAAQVILYVQGAATLIGVILQIYFIKDRTDHGQDVDSLLYFLTLVSLVAAVLAIICAVNVIVRGRDWARALAVTAEVMAILFGLINIVTGTITGVFGIALSIAVLVLLFSSSGTEWVVGDGRR